VQRVVAPLPGDLDRHRVIAAPVERPVIGGNDLFQKIERIGCAVVSEGKAVGHGRVLPVQAADTETAPAWRVSAPHPISGVKERPEHHE
jgi:hypothetical protein